MKTSLSLVVLWVGLAVPAPQVHGQDYDFYTNIDETITIIRYLGPGADVVIPNTIDGRLVTAIGAPAGPAFAGPAVRSITIPGTVTEIRRFRATGDDIPQTGPYAFYGCSNLEAVHVDPSNLNYSSVSGVLLNKPQTRLLQCPAGKQGDYMIPRSVTNVGQYAFSGCSRLTSITIPDSVISISGATWMVAWNRPKSGAFCDCTSLTEITIPASVADLEAGAFYGCTNLTSITVSADNPCFSTVDGVLFDKHQNRLLEYPAGKIGNYTAPATVTAVGYGAFYDCVNLSTVNLPQSVTNIDTGGWGGAGWFPDAFQGCTHLTDIIVDLANPVYSSLDGVVYDKSRTTLVCCPPGKPGSYSIPNGVISVGPYAFSHCTSLVSVHVPDSVLDLHRAFLRCPALTSIVIGGSVTNIENALSGCSNLTWVTLQNGIRRIGYETFEGCTSLKTITVPDSVTTIEEYAFLNCAKLRSICFEGDTPSVPTWSQGVLGGTEATVSYLPGSIGWNATFCGRPTAVWLPQILSDDSSFGVRDNEFGSTINWARSKTVVIEAATSLANPSWLPVSTNTLVEGPAYFSDAEWTNYPARFYRVRAQ